jgi:threonine synthase
MTLRPQLHRTRPLSSQLLAKLKKTLLNYLDPSPHIHPKAGSGEAARMAVQRVVPLARHAALNGLRCLRCEALYLIAGIHGGCPVCAAQGVHVSLRASYRKTSGQSRYLPYVPAMALGEGNTPLSDSADLAAATGVARFSIKDESANPTGSHKDRMSAIGVTQALEIGAHTIVLASSGNAAVSTACYAGAAGLHCEIAVYDGMPEAYTRQLDAHGARRFSFPDNESRWNFVNERAKNAGYFALTNHQLPALGSAPLAIEGYKAIAYECHDAGCTPQHILVPTARGDLIWGIYAGYRDLLEAGEISRLPKLWAVEPFARLSRVLQGENLHGLFAGTTAQFSTAGSTVTYLQWQAATATGGGAVVVDDGAARTARQLLGQHGYSAELCAAAGLAGVQKLRAQKKIDPHEQVLLILTASSSIDPSWPDPV